MNIKSVLLIIVLTIILHVVIVKSIFNKIQIENFYSGKKKVEKQVDVEEIDYDDENDEEKLLSMISNDLDHDFDISLENETEKKNI